MSYYKRQNRKLRMTVGGFVMVLIGFIVYIFQHYFTQVNFVGQLNDTTAASNVEKFRGRILFPKKKGWGVWYNANDIRLYLDSIYPRLVDSQKVYIASHTPQGIELKNCVWKVDFYWMRAEDRNDGKTKTDFCVVPVLVDTTTKPMLVYDYFNTKLKLYDHSVIFPYKDPQWKRYLGDEEGSYSYDTGNMFP